MFFVVSTEDDSIWLLQATLAQVTTRALVGFVCQVLSLLMTWSGDYCMQMVSNIFPRKQQAKEPWAPTAGPGARVRIKGVQ